MMPFLVPAALSLAKDPVPSDSEIGPGIVYPVVFGALVLVSVLLWVSMRRQLRKIDFDEQGPEADTAPDELKSAEPAEPGDTDRR